MAKELRERLMRLHQKLEQAIMNERKETCLTVEEVEDLCEFLDSFLYD